MPDQSKLRPVAFMVMPFGKRTLSSPPRGAPAQLDCNALWDRAFRPALENLGYLPIRADAEAGTVIVKDMLERLAWSSLVLADLSLPNGNVYYEIGLRHAAKRTHCVLIAADWSDQLFDVDQMRTSRYPLKDGTVPEAEAEVIRKRIEEIVPKMKDSLTPFYELVKDKHESTVFRDQMVKISEFQAEVRAIRLMKDKDARVVKLAELQNNYANNCLEIPEVALDFFTLVRDSRGWGSLANFVSTLPQSLQEHPFTKEQLLLEKSEIGDHQIAIEGLKELINLQGETPERHGLIGGRYKRLWREARDARLKSGANTPGLEECAYLDSAIDHYNRGTELDLNAYYCPSNLPALLRARGNPGDEEEATYLDKHIVRACMRTIERGEDDGWAKPTLLGAAFRTHDVERVRKLTLDVAKQGPAAWQLKSTLADITDTVNTMADGEIKTAIANERDKLEELANKL